MKFLLQYEIEDEMVTKIATANEIIELYGYSDFNCAENITVFLIKAIGVFIPCKIVHSHNEVVDKFGHIDMWCDIVDTTTNEPIASACYQEHWFFRKEGVLWK